MGMVGEIHAVSLQLVTALVDVKLPRIIFLPQKYTEVAVLQ